MAKTTETQVTAAEAKPPLKGGGGIRAIVPQDFESAYRLATVVVKSGMAPKSIDTVEKACVAIMHGLELGLTPMAALQSIAVVNGMPTVWGDGMLALVRGSGLLEDIKEHIELDKKDGLPVFGTVKVKRKGQSSWVEHTFTRAQAIKAGLWGKAGPWSNYPQRMMIWRPRAWALRDAFPDVLRGLQAREEVEDMVDITDAASATTSPPRSDYVFEREPTRADFQHAEEAGEAEVEHDAETGEVYQAQEAPPRADEPPPVDNKAEASNPWYPDAVGQEAATAAIVELIKTKATTDADLDAIVEANAERVKKFTQANRATINNALDDRRDDLKGGGA